MVTSSAPKDGPECWHIHDSLVPAHICQAALVPIPAISKCSLSVSCKPLSSMSSNKQERSSRSPKCQAGQQEQIEYHTVTLTVRLIIEQSLARCHKPAVFPWGRGHETACM